MTNTSNSAEAARWYRPMVQTAVAGAVVGLVVAGTGSDFGSTRIGDWRRFLEPRSRIVFDLSSPSPEITAERPDLRTAAEHIDNIRKVLDPAVSDLATLFEVSRQAVYKWISGESIPDEKNFDRIRTLGGIADRIREAGIRRTGSLLKMKAFSGCSLMDIVRSGEIEEIHVDTLIAEARRRESSLEGSETGRAQGQRTDDWQSDLSIPGSLGHD